MTIADKILNLRKKHNLSQEELAEKLDVSRQSVSKWESATSIPDITKIMAIAKLFSVSTDYLLRDDLQNPEYTGEEEKTTEHIVSIEESNNFLKAFKMFAKRIALGVALCILSPTVLIFLNTVAEDKNSGFNITPELANTLGLIWLFLSIAVAVGLFILSGAMAKPYDYLKSGNFELSFGVSGIIKERQTAFMPIRVKKVIISISLFILSALPLIISSVMGSSETMVVIMLIFMFFIVAIGVYNLIICEIEKQCYDRLLLEGEFRFKNSELRANHERISKVYWPLVTAIYLGWSLITHNWSFTWIIWPVSALLFSAVSAFFHKE